MSAEMVRKKKLKDNARDLLISGAVGIGSFVLSMLFNYSDRGLAGCFFVVLLISLLVDLGALFSIAKAFFSRPKTGDLYRNFNPRDVGHYEKDMGADALTV